MKVKQFLFFCIIGLLFTLPAMAEGGEGHPAEEFNPGETMMHHVLDTHDWHITDYPTGETNEKGEKLYKSVAIHLPWLFYSEKHGLEFYANTHSLLESGKYFVYHEHAYHIPEGKTYDMETHGAHTHGEEYEAYMEEFVDLDMGTGHPIQEAKIYDFSPTKTVVQMLLVLLILTWVFISVAKGYAKNKGGAPKGVQSLFEPVVKFVRDDIARVYLGEKADKYTPYLLTLFFFIWFSNLLGITPFNSNIMGNLSITFTLALFTFILVQLNGTKDYWTHIFAMPWAMPGVPKWVVFLTTPIEIFGMFTKGIALMIRLFANISAGHFMILALVSLIFIMGKGGENIGGALGIMPLSVLFTIGILMLEIVVGAVQAYVFVLLTAVFVGQAMEKHDDHH
jgi:F-type H+-transporting ATPase subunit a